MNLRYVVPALGLMALSASAASAQEIAKGVTLDGYVDTIGTAETGNKKFGSSTTDFSSEAVLMVGWAPTDRISAKVVTRNGDAFSGGTENFNVSEAYGSVKANDQLTVSSGKSTGPFGYYSQYATGVNFVTGVLSTHLYTVNPVGVWATYTVNDKVTATAIVADTFFGGNKANRPASVSPGVDVVFNVTPEISLNLELAVDPNGSPTPDADGAAGDVYYASFNGQFKQGPLTVAGEILYQVVQNNGETNDDDQSNVAGAGFVTYAVPDLAIPLAVTGQISGYKDGETVGMPDGKTAYKGQLAVLTNPLQVSQFGLNYELFYMSIDNGGKANKDSFGVAIEGLYVLP